MGLISILHDKSEISGTFFILHHNISHADGTDNACVALLTIFLLVILQLSYFPYFLCIPSLCFLVHSFLYFIMISALSERRRDRVAKACGVCRRKKIKCDGGSPCSHCKNFGCECEYPVNKPRKPRTRTSIDSLDSRLDRLELLMVKMVQKMDGSERSVPLRSSSSTKLESTTSSPSSQSASLPRSEEKDSYFQQCQTILDKTIDPVNQPDLKVHHMLHYKGLHSGFAMLFSSQSIEWIRARLRPEDHHITRPFETLFYYIWGWKKFFSSVWAEPKAHSREKIEKLREGIFPDDRELVDELMSYYDLISMSGFICDKSDVVALFDQYYTNKSLPPKKKHKFTWSELMVMSINLALTIAVAAEKKNEDSAFVVAPLVPTPKLDAISTDYLVSLQEEFFLNTVFYFHRICVVNEGPRTVQALLLVAFHLETSSMSSEVNYSLACMALQYAQQLGLHRHDTFEYVSDVERRNYSRLWSAVQCLDLEMAYRLGKPPLINMFDVSTLTPSDPNYVSSLVYPTAEDNAANVPVTLNYIFFFSYKLSQLRSFCYVQLFSANVRYDNLKHVQEIVTSLNTNMVDLAQEMDEELRPRYFFEPDFDKLLRLLALDFHRHSLNEAMVIFHLTFFYNISIINRVPCQIPPGEAESPAHENSTFRRIALDSSRTILHIVRAIDLRRISLFAVTWLSFYPFVATTNLISHCLNNTDDPDCYKDLSLIIDVSMCFFGHYSKIAEKPSTRIYYLKLHVLDLLTRILLRIAVKVYEERSGLDILSGNDGLRNHLESVEKKYPQFYSEVNDPSDMVHLINCIYDSPFSSNRRFSANLNSPFNTTPNSNSGSSPMNAGVPRKNPSPRRNDPSLVNILRPAEFDDVDFAMRDFMLSDDFLNLASTREFSNLPNFFFDNGL